MFNTEFNHLIQSFDSQFLYWFLYFITILGYAIPVTLVLLINMYGINYKKGFLVLNFLLWASIFTSFLKEEINYPRPLEVDNSLNVYHYNTIEDNLNHLQPTSFFELFSNDLLNRTRINTEFTSGFPSGHTSLQLSIWISIALLYRKRWLWIFGPAFVLLTGFSRIYLSQHFLGDIFGGLILGTVLVLLLYQLIKFTSIFKSKIFTYKQLYLFLLPLLLFIFYDKLITQYSGILIGFNLAILTVVWKWGFPQTNPTIYARLKNCLLILIFYVPFQLISRMVDFNSSFILFLYSAVGTYIVFLGTAIIGKRFNLLIFNNAELI